MILTSGMLCITMLFIFCDKCLLQMKLSYHTHLVHFWIDVSAGVTVLYEQLQLYDLILQLSCIHMTQ